MNEKLIEEIEIQEFHMWRYYFEIVNGYQYSCTSFFKELPWEMLFRKKNMYNNIN